MSDYKAVRSTVEISRRIVCYLDMFDPQYFNGTSHAKAVRKVNDILQGRSEQTVETLLGELRQKGPALADKAERIGRELQDFQEQKALLKEPYKKCSGTKYNYQMHGGDTLHPLKLIDQRLYDRAAANGFPPGFFRDSHFDHVTLYCLPDAADLHRSEFHGCTFAVCRISSADFAGARIYDSTFHSCQLRGVSFLNADIAHTHFRDCTFSETFFVQTHMIRCNTIDCTIEHTDFLNAVLDGCTYGRVKAADTRELHTALITQGGATAGECRENRAAIYKALGVSDPEPPPPLTLHVKRKRRSGPER